MFSSLNFLSKSECIFPAKCPSSGRGMVINQQNGHGLLLEQQQRKEEEENVATTMNGNKNGKIMHNKGGNIKYKWERNRTIWVPPIRLMSYSFGHISTRKQPILKGDMPF